MSRALAAKRFWLAQVHLYFLGKYKLDGTVYIGAICETADSSGYCTSKIIGYLPRIGLVERPTVDGGLFTGIATEITNLLQAAVTPITNT